LRAEGARNPGLDHVHAPNQERNRPDEIHQGDASLLSSAIWGAAFGGLGSAAQDAIVGIGPAITQANFNSLSAGQKNLLLGIADFNGTNLFTPGKGTVVGAGIANGVISGGPSFIPTAGGASCTCTQ
jgi:hypothetical protein